LAVGRVRIIAIVLKTIERKFRGFKSHTASQVPVWGKGSPLGSELRDFGSNPDTGAMPASANGRQRVFHTLNLGSTPCAGTTVC
jgi:hypothetical protein